MTNAWHINPEWEYLSTGTPEERASFAALSIYARGQCLTEGRDALANRLRTAPYLSAYALAEWMAWNWWRLRWEPRTQGIGWTFAHRVRNIGEGYIWPNITIYSDGERVVVAAKPTPERSETPFRYIADIAVMISASELELGIEDFTVKVIDRLDSEHVRNTNLQRIWQDVQRERRDPSLAARRKLEALLGHDPEEADAGILDQLLADANQIGMAATQEIAASAGTACRAAYPPSVAVLRDLAKNFGLPGQPLDAVRLVQPTTRTSRAQTPAWRLGADMAHALRAQESLGGGAISDAKLAAMLGTSAKACQPKQLSKKLDFAFLFENQAQASNIVLRSSWRSGRRFELARLLSAKLLADADTSLFAATVAYTYQQKAQRAFAAELLSPFDAVVSMLDGDVSEENLQMVANHFQVSELTIRTLLVNHGVLDRNEIDSEQFALVA